MERVLIVSGAEKAAAFLTRVFHAFTTQIQVATNAGQARRLLLEQDTFSVVAIHAPLPDETGLPLAEMIADRTEAGVLLVASADFMEEFLQPAGAKGIALLQKPVMREDITQAARLLFAFSHRLAALREENQRLRAKLQEAHVISRAKCEMISRLGYTEEQAHRTIEKRAMDSRRTRCGIAEEILAAFHAEE